MRADLPYLVSQQHVTDLGQILLGEHKAHIPTDMREQPEEKTTSPQFRFSDNVSSSLRTQEHIQRALPTFLRQGYSPDDHE